jgi:WD40 repeat protein
MDCKFVEISPGQILLPTIKEAD